MTDKNSIGEAPSSIKKRNKLSIYSGIFAIAATVVGAHQIATSSNIDKVIKSTGETTNVDNKEQAPIVEKEESSQEPSPQAEKPVKLDVTQYVPPAELGTIVERKINPDSKKTVVYLPDIHTEVGLFDKKGSEKGFKTQYQLYKIVEDVLGKQSGPIPLVIESWPEGKGAEYLKSLPVEATNHREVAEVAHIEDRKERIDKANAYIGRTFSPAGDMLAAAYPDRIVVLGVENPEMERRRMVLIDTEKKIEEVINNGFISCTIFDPGIKNQSLTLEEAIKMQIEDLDADGKSCICKSQDLLIKIRHDTTMERLKVGEIEAKTGVGAQGDVVFIMAGAMHLRSSRAYFDKHNINYIVISPNTIADEVGEMKKIKIEKDRKGLPERLKPLCQNTTVLSDEVYTEIVKTAEDFVTEKLIDIGYLNMNRSQSTF